MVASTHVSPIFNILAFTHMPAVTPSPTSIRSGCGRLRTVISVPAPIHERARVKPGSSRGSPTIGSGNLGPHCSDRIQAHQLPRHLPLPDRTLPRPIAAFRISATGSGHVVLGECPKREATKLIHKKPHQFARFGKPLWHRGRSGRPARPGSAPSACPPA